MKGKRFLNVCMALLVVTGFVGCSSDNDEDFTFKDYQLENIISLAEKGQIPSQFKNVSELPSWLQTVEESPGYLRPIYVYQFSWKGSTYFLWYGPYMSGPYDGFFTKDGEHLDGHALWEDIKANSHGWALIYVAHPRDAKE